MLTIVYSLITLAVAPALSTCIRSETLSKQGQHTRPLNRDSVGDRIRALGRSVLLLPEHDRNVSLGGSCKESSEPEHLLASAVVACVPDFSSKAARLAIVGVHEDKVLLNVQTAWPLRALLLSCARGVVNDTVIATAYLEPCRTLSCVEAKPNGECKELLTIPGVQWHSRQNGSSTAVFAKTREGCFLVAGGKIGRARFPAEVDPADVCGVVVESEGCTRALEGVQLWGVTVSGPEGTDPYAPSNLLADFFLVDGLLATDGTWAFAANGDRQPRLSVSQAELREFRSGTALLAFSQSDMTLVFKSGAVDEGGLGLNVLQVARDPMQRTRRWALLCDPISDSARWLAGDRGRHTPLGVQWRGLGFGAEPQLYFALSASAAHTCLIAAATCEGGGLLVRTNLFREGPQVRWVVSTDDAGDGQALIFMNRASQLLVGCNPVEATGFSTNARCDVVRMEDGARLRSLKASR